MTYGNSKNTKEYDFTLIGTIKPNTFNKTKEAFWGSLYTENLRKLLEKSKGKYIKLKAYPKNGSKDEFLLQALTEK